MKTKLKEMSLHHRLFMQEIIKWLKKRDEQLVKDLPNEELVSRSRQLEHELVTFLDRTLIHPNK